MERVVPTREAIVLPARRAGGPGALDAGFVPEPADESDQGDEPWV